MEPGSRKRKYPYPVENKPTRKGGNKFCLDLHNVPPIPSLNAFERGYEVESILDMVQNSNDEHFFFVKFKNLPKPELVSVEVVLEKAPDMMGEFYKEYVEAWKDLGKKAP